MSLTWTPLEVQPGATPEEAFAAGAVHSHDSKIILLAWVKGVGWCGVRYAEARHTDPPPPQTMLLLRVDDIALLSVPYRIANTLTLAEADNVQP